MGEKSNELGGQRSNIRHNLDNLGAFGVAYAALQYFVDADKLTPQQAMLAFGAVMAIGSSLLKAWSTFELTARIKKRLDKSGFTTSILPVLFALLLLPGCAIQLGRATPHSFQSMNGETIVACTIEGISIAVGDADICRNVEGGHVSHTFADLALGIVKVAGAAVAGFFSGLGGAGDGMQDAISEVDVEPEAPTPPAVEAPAASFVVPSFE